ncbi:4-oxalocrotonate tautomerase family protein [Streptomyces sp. NPDC003737]|uniref:tautomerase family protein n=1 Tax=Streptomyces sp. NPDC003737 TaxID=3364685 RepID=UPI00369A84BB
MVFVRVHVMKDKLSAEEKRELGDKLIAAVAEVEKLRNTERHQQASWVQYYEFDPDNWYNPHTLGDPSAQWQIDVIAPRKLLPTPEETKLVLEKVTAAVRSVSGEGLLPARGPWVHVYVVPDLSWGMDGRVPNWDGWRAYFEADTQEEVDRALATVFGKD